MPAFFYEGGFDLALLLSLLKQAPGLADFVDERGNVQSAVRLDLDEDGVLVTVPKGTEREVVDAAVAQYVPPPPTPLPQDAVLAAIMSLDPSTATVADVINVVKAALQAAGASP